MSALAPRLLRANLLVAFAVGLRWLAGARDWDRDEAFYTLGGAWLREGRLPYRDFFWPQAPLAAGWSAFAGLLREGLLGGRLAAVLATLIAATLIAHGLRRARGDGASLGALLLFAGALPVLQWCTVGKTYAPAAMLLVGALLAPVRLGLHRRGVPAAALAGLLLGLSGALRLTTLAALPGVALLAAGGPDGRRARLLAFAAGLAAPLSLYPLCFALDPARAFFGNLGFHALRSEAGLVGDLPQKLGLAARLALDPHLLVAFALAVVGVLAARARGPGDRLEAGAALAGLGLVLSTLVPTPAWEQYVTFAYGPLALAAGPGLAHLAALPRRGALVAGLVVALFLGATFARRAELLVPFVDGARFSRAQSDALTTALRARARPGDELLASWPGHAVDAGLRPPDGHGNDSGSAIVDRTLDAASAAKMHVRGWDDAKARIAADEVRFVVTGEGAAAADLGPEPDAAALAGYELVHRSGALLLWERRR